MPALDQCHPQAVRALEKAGWTITASPLTLETPLHDHFADIAASRSSAIGSRQIIVVEVKCFPPNSHHSTELYVAIGQYLVYRELLVLNGIDAQIYLAIPTRAYYGIFEALGVSVAKKVGIKLIVVDVEHAEVEQWLE
jgi:hypothetical protein